MPVTINVAGTVPEPVKTWLVDYEVEELDDLLLFAYPATRSEPLAVIHSSYEVGTQHERTGPSSNGFFLTFLNAYNHHHHVRIRADDVWIAIICQLSNYIRSRPEELSHLFKHTRKKNLTVMIPSRHAVDYPAVTEHFVEMMRESSADDEIFDWFSPNFSTTTSTDRAVVSMVMAATMQKFFNLSLVTYCGIPSVTLLGCVQDYEALLAKLDFLSTFGDEPRRFAELLRPIVLRFVLSFANPQATQEFWGRSIDKESRRSGQMILSGWMTAFCFWDNEGNCQYDSAWPEKDEKGPLIIDGAAYQPLRVEDVTVCCSRMPINMMDRGQRIQLHLFAGTMGITCSASSGIENADGSDTSKPVFDTIMPEQGWFICETTND